MSDKNIILRVTHQQALWAVELIRNIVDQAFGSGEKIATTIVVSHEITKQMRELIEEIRAND